MEYITLPKALLSEEQFTQLVNQYKALRLFSLKQSPKFFGSNHAREEAFPRETWVSRLTNPLATNIVAVARPDDLDLTSEEARLQFLLEGTWLASLTLVGPLDPLKAKEMYETAMHIAPGVVDLGPSDGADGVKWQFALNAMYVKPEGRGRGLAKKIVQEAVRLAVNMGEGQPVKVVLVVDYDNVAARGVYERSGFDIIYRYWFDDQRPGRGDKTEAAVMSLVAKAGDVPV
ncbi:hypothetical protein ACHAQA_001507 [Verticillium albo-atrum]